LTYKFTVQTDLAEYHKLGLDISELEKKIMSEMIRPERALLYLVPGRLVGNSTLHKFCSFLWTVGYVHHHFVWLMRNCRNPSFL
jgi:hypothetical protein